MIAMLVAAGLAGTSTVATPRAWCGHLAHSASTIAEAKLSGVSRIRLAAGAALVDDQHERAALLDLISLAFDGNAADQASPAELADITYTACMRGI